MMKRKAPEPATPSAARRDAEADSDNDAAAAATAVTALGAADAEAAALQAPALVAELESVWHTIGRALGVSEAADPATRQAALLRWAGFEWGRDGALTAHPEWLMPSPLALHLLPVDVATCVLSLLPFVDRLQCAAVARAWRTLARRPAAWARLTWPFKEHKRDPAFERPHGNGVYVFSQPRPSLSKALEDLALLLHGARDAPLTSVVHLGRRNRFNRFGWSHDWEAVVRQCPSLRELCLGVPRRFDGTFKLRGDENGTCPGYLLALLEASPVLRLPDVHVKLRTAAGSSMETLQQLRALLAHPRASVATLSVRTHKAFKNDGACVEALGDILESADAASLRSLYFSRCAAGLAYSLAGALGLSFGIEHVRIHKLLRRADRSAPARRGLPIPVLQPGKPPLTIEFDDDIPDDDSAGWSVRSVSYGGFGHENSDSESDGVAGGFVAVSGESDGADDHPDDGSDGSGASDESEEDDDDSGEDA